MRPYIEVGSILVDKNDWQEGMEDVDEELMASEPSLKASEPKRITITDDFMSPEAPDEEPEDFEEPESTWDEADTEETEMAPTIEDTDTTPEPIMAEGAIVETEIEPETSASMVEQEPATGGAPESRSQLSDAGVPRTAPVGIPAMGLTTNKQKDKKRQIIIIAASVVFLVLAGVVAWWLLAVQNDATVSDRANDTSSAPIEQPKLSIAATNTDGTVEYLRTGTEWQALDTTTKLQEGDSIRTGTESRAILTFSDDSIARLDADTTVELVGLAADKVEITQTTGKLYSRVATGERKYIVTVDGSTYEALGTAFTTLQDLTKSGVQVYQGTVQASDITNGSIAEGKQLYRPFGDFMGPLEVVAIDIDTLADDTFMHWNIAEDEKIPSFKNVLGILPQIKQRFETIQQERLAQEEKQAIENEAAEKAAAEKTAKEKAEKEKPATEEKNTPTP